MASLTVSSSDLTESFIATSFGPSSPKDNRTSTFTFPMNTPDNKHVCDLELGGTSSVPCTHSSSQQSLLYSIHQVRQINYENCIITCFLIITLIVISGEGLRQLRRVHRFEMFVLNTICNRSKPKQQLKSRAYLAGLQAKQVDNSIYSFSQAFSRTKTVLIYSLEIRAQAFPSIPKIRHPHFQHIICGNNLQILQLVFIFNTIIFSLASGRVNLKKNQFIDG